LRGSALKREFDVLSLQKDSAGFKAMCYIDPDLVYFDGHFPQKAILPGVVQIHLILHVISLHLGRKVDLKKIKRSKYIAPIFPGQKIQIQITLQESVANWRLNIDKQLASMGTLCFAPIE
jgi:3-hydroxymyristoyl/3-hydroxydecanoyl-(acyl carrier protein) dehydratase